MAPQTLLLRPYLQHWLVIGLACAGAINGYPNDMLAENGLSASFTMAAESCMFADCAPNVDPGSNTTNLDRRQLAGELHVPL